MLKFCEAVIDILEKDDGLDWREIEKRLIEDGWELKGRLPRALQILEGSHLIEQAEIWSGGLCWVLVRHSVCPSRYSAFRKANWKPEDLIWLSVPEGSSQSSEGDR